MVAINTSLLKDVSPAVIPVESPTVAKAETTSNKIVIKFSFGSAIEIAIVPQRTVTSEPKETAIALSSSVFGT